jgi:hypothetical protein
MSLIARTPLVGAYVCPRGVFIIECKRAHGGLEIERTLEVPLPLESPIAAADHLIQVLRTAGINRADVAIAVRGYGVVHHVLQMPPASDEMLSPIIDREIRRLEPQLGDAVVDWVSLPALETGVEGTTPRSLLGAAAPVDVIMAFEQRLKVAGYRLMHITALPVAMQRLFEEFDEGSPSAALVAPLPDGAFLGFTMNAAIRLVIEPPLPQDVDHETAALAEEVELGMMFVRQQFRGAEIERVALVGSKDSLANAESALFERLHVPVAYLGVRDLSPAAFAALGAILDAQSPKPLSLGGTTRESARARAMTTLESVSIAALLILALLGAWTVTETVRAKRAAMALETTRQQIERESFGLGPVRSTAEQRRLVRDAVAALRFAASDRVELQETLSGIASAIGERAQVDSMHLDRKASGWRAVVSGSITGVTNARAVQSLNDLYRELPQRLAADSMHLDQLAYDDEGSTQADASVVRFQLSFGIPAARKQ